MKVLFTTFIALLLFISVSDLKAQDKNWFQVYGFAMTDIGYNFNQIHPALV